MVSNDLEEGERELDDEQLVLGDLLNHVLDRGLVVGGTVTISIADIDLIILDLRLVLTSVETAVRRSIGMRRADEPVNP